MLSRSRSFLFIHVPKTAGNAIQDALRDHADDRIVCLAPHHDGVQRFEIRSDRYRTVKHSTLAEYRREYGTALTSRLFTFSCVRNPWERCMSHFFSPHRGAVRWDRDAFIEFVARTVQPARHYLSASPAEPLADAVAGLDFVIRHERLREGFAEACSRIGLPELPIQVRNASLEADPLRHYDAETIRIVGDRFHEEIECFGYALPASLRARQRSQRRPVSITRAAAEPVELKLAA